MKNNKELFQSSQFITHKALEVIFKNYLVEKETLLMSFKLTIGRTSIAKINCTHNEGIVSIKPYFDNEFIIRDFLNIFLPVISNLGNTKNAIKGKTLNSKSIGSLLIPLPPLEEQKRIVKIINSLNVFIDEYSFLKNYLKKLEEEFPSNLKKSILNYAMNGKLVKQDENDSSINDLLKQIYREKQEIIKQNRSKEFELVNSIIYKNASDNSYYEKFEDSIEEKIEVPFEIPNNWVWVRHNMILKLIGGSQPPKSTFISYPKDNYIRLFQIRDYGDSPIPVYIPINKASKITNKGDILIARYGGSLGKVFIAEYGAYNVAMSKVTKLYINDHIDFNFLYFFYKSKIFQEIIRRNSRSAQDGFNSEEINDLLLPLPPLEEQEQIVNKINKINVLIDSMTN
ncbi:restriction endonuclease subunit S [Mycoplasma mycoides subsp. capri]|uniref:restriction endonuclease subunit S n=3 Tax=Mycoplasma mycoides TaxID=2102 RepID=UPI00223F8B73|nr:restriction endonuclease subunit S [Mycoplasma mycoides]QVK04699.1 restriction endonuclease subunit S [Mycoplasma mycoides subsp. capri]